MSDARILFPQFRDEQSASRYPFADNALLSSNSGTITIPSDVFVDASIYGIGLGVQVYISSIVVTAQTLTIYIGDNGGTNKLSGSYPILAPPASGVIDFTDTYGRPAGILLADKVVNGASPLNVFAAWPVGVYTFAAASTEFVASVVIPANEPGVRGFVTEQGDLLTQDIWLVGNAGVVLRRVNGEIRIDVIGVPLFKRLVCAPQTEFPTKKFLKTINQCGPDEYGNFTFTATEKTAAHTVARIYPLNETLVFDTVGPKAI